MKICIDDGSTNIKLAWTENGERRNAISPNSFKSEWSAPFGGSQPANYMLDGVRYGFDPVSDRFVRTTDTQYQYSDVNVIAIHHALVKSGITPQEVDVVVTLPLSEYFDTNAQPDMANINRKKANVMRPVEYQNGEAFTVRNVRVMPESIPAGFKALADMSPFESLLIVDLGGTTLDVAKVQGQMAGISQVFCDPHVGVSLMTDAVLSVMATNGMRTSHHVASTIIEHRHDEAWLRQHIHNDAHYNSLTAVIREKEETLKQRVIRALAVFSGYGQVMVVGGGAEIVAPAVHDAYGLNANIHTTPEPQFALVNGLHAISEGKA
ncbi:plasmid segregation protein ParM [Escherichia coli]|nr:plasmid segregation protein ParM [Escherichia coli]